MFDLYVKGLSKGIFGLYATVILGKCNVDYPVNPF